MSMLIIWLFDIIFGKSFTLTFLNKIADDVLQNDEIRQPNSVGKVGVYIRLTFSNRYATILVVGDI